MKGTFDVKLHFVLFFMLYFFTDQKYYTNDKYQNYKKEMHVAVPEINQVILTFRFIKNIKLTI